MRAREVMVSGMASVAMMVTGCHGEKTVVAPTARTETSAGSATPAAPLKLNVPLDRSFARWEQEGPTGDEAHRAGLEKLVVAVREQVQSKHGAEILFVCTHNSRRSHMAQLLGIAAARRNGVAGISTFSGGTEATAFNPRAVSALERVGFEISPTSKSENPHSAVRFSPSAEPADVFSKRIGDAPNPTTGFVVVMTCSQADAACPYVPGAATRVAIPYEDPKAADGTPEETTRYDERVAQIGRDLAWVFATVARH